MNEGYEAKDENQPRLNFNLNLTYANLQLQNDSLKGRTIRKLLGGAGEVQKKNSRNGKLN